jgi:ABC-type transport system involved in cytochrome c biogenesis ATPase subunit
MLTCDDISCTNWGKTLFKRLGFSLLPGSLLAVTGGSPKAKTALVDVIAGLKEPKRGEVTFDGSNVWRNIDYFANTLHIGAGAMPDPSETVENTLMRFTATYETQNLVNAALSYFGLSDYSGCPCAILPAALLPRVALARLLAVPCGVWLFDIPLDSLDDEGRAMLFALISGSCNRGGIVIVAADKADFISPIQALDLDDFA